MDGYDGDRWEPIRRAMGQTGRLAERVNLRAMVPRGDLASTGYCLADPGKEYVVYLPEGGEVTVDLSAAAGELEVEWMHPVGGSPTPGVETPGGAKRTFQAPFAGDAALHLRRR
jgi:hypothetical protein